MNFSRKFGADQTIWYPASGYRSFDDVSLYYVGNDGYYWSASPNKYYAYHLSFGNGGGVNTSLNSFRAHGRSVRCLQAID